LCKAPTVRIPAQTHRRLRSLTGLAVDRDEVERIRKRFMKLDKVRCSSALGHLANLIDRLLQDNSGTIEREEFLSLPQISSNPLATRLVARSLFSR
jgi:serine/threonine-protein phosphatase 2B regulatory subunit